MGKKGKAMHDVAIDIGPAVLVQRRVENPLRTEAMLHAALDAGEEGGVAGWIDASVNLVTMIGGLARIKGLTREQQVAAARYRSLFERAQIGSARATDYSAVRVDTSGSSHDVVEDGAAARREYADAARRLGLVRSGLLEKVLCHEMSLREIARALGAGQGGAARGRVQGELVGIVDQLVDHFGTGRRRVRGEGQRANWNVGADEPEPH